MSMMVHLSFDPGQSGFVRDCVPGTVEFSVMFVAVLLLMSEHDCSSCLVGMNNERLQTASSMRRVALYAASSALVRAQHHFDQDNSYATPIQVQQHTVERVVVWLRRTLRLLAFAVFAMASSLLMYGLFYWTVMPPHHAVQQLYFDYTCDRTVESTRGENETCLSVDSAACSPIASVDLFARHSSWKAFQSEVLPSPIAGKRSLRPGQPYFVEIALKLPESERNLRVGMFGVSVKMYSTNGTALATSMRSARLPHETGWVGTLRKLTFVVPLMVGAIAESRTVIIPSFRHYMESEAYPLRHVTVQLMPSRTAWQDGPLEVLTGELWLGKELSPFQLLLKDWFYSCFMAGTFLILLAHVLALAVGRMLWDERRRRMREARVDVDLAAVTQEEQFVDEDTGFGNECSSQQEHEDDDGFWADMQFDDSTEVEPAPLSEDIVQQNRPRSRRSFGNGSVSDLRVGSSEEAIATGGRHGHSQAEPLLRPEARLSLAEEEILADSRTHGDP